MSDKSDKIVNTFQERRELEQAVAAMAQTTSEAQLVGAARSIKLAWEPALILPVLLRHLNTGSSQLRGGLARLAALLPREQVVPALRGYAVTRSNPPLGRTTAAMILDEFLGESIPRALVSDAGESTDAASQSLREAVEEGESDPRVLLDYVTQMERHGEEIAHLVMQHLDLLPAGQRVELLRLIGQDERPGPRRAAWQRLEALAAAGEITAARALYTLHWMLPPDAAAEVERTLRKLHMRGKGYVPPQPAGWEALLLPAQVGGTAWLFVLQPAADHDAERTMLALELSLGQGIAVLSERSAPDKKELRQLQARGPLASLPVADALGLLQRALGAHWQNAPLPLPPDLRLYSNPLFTFAPSQDTLALLLDSPPAREPLTNDEAAAVVAQLLRQPSMKRFRLQLEQVDGALIEELVERPHGSELTLARAILGQVAAGEMLDELNQALCNALLLQAIHLHYSATDGPQEHQLARDTVRLAHSLDQWRAAENPLLLQMTVRELLALRARSRSGSGGRRTDS